MLDKHLFGCYDVLIGRTNVLEGTIMKKRILVLSIIVVAVFVLILGV